MNVAHPLFSIITVTYNAANTVKPTMQSVAEQSCTLYEHIVMDGASKDDTVAVAHQFATERTKVFSSPDKGIYDAMNKGMGVATGDYLIFLNAGDRFHSPHTLQELADAIMANDYPGVVYGQTQLVDIDNNYIGPRHLTAPDKLTLDSFKHGMLVCHQAFTALRNIASLYDTKWRFSADYDWCIKCLQHSRRNVYTGTTTINYLSEGVTTQNRRKSLIERYKIMSHYYGAVPTFLRHLAFIPRFIKTTLLKK